MLQLLHSVRKLSCFTSSSSRCTTKRVGFSTLEPKIWCRAESYEVSRGKQKLGEIDVDCFAETFGYTWLSHWKLLEEDSAFRQNIIESKSNRRNSRHQYLRTMFEAQLENLNESGKELGVEEESLKLPNLMRNNETEERNSHTVGEDYDSDLEWLSSHPSSMIGEVDVDHKNGIQVLLGDKKVSIIPMWVSVFVDGPKNSAKLFESVVPLEDDVLSKANSHLQSFLEIEGLQFDDLAEMKSGRWRNYFIGLIGEVSSEEDGNLWPNQVLHKDRCLFNVRDATDLARFLSDPRKEDVEKHLENLERLAIERNYKRGWCWHMLRSRWGEKNLHKMGFSKVSVVDVL